MPLLIRLIGTEIRAAVPRGSSGIGAFAAASGAGRKVSGACLWNVEIGMFDLAGFERAGFERARKLGKTVWLVRKRV